jgi:hypothetical protein
MEKEQIDQRAPELQGPSFGDILQEQIQNAPAWFISLAIHALLLVLATFAVFAIERIQQETPTIIKHEPIKFHRLEIPDLQRGIWDVPGLAPEEGTQAEPDELEPQFPGATLAEHTETSGGDTPKGIEGIDLGPIIVGRELFESGIGLSGGSTAWGNTIWGNTMGIRGGSRSPVYGNRMGPGRENLAKQRGSTKATESAVNAALRWLARHQNEDGSWSPDRFDRHCKAQDKCDGFGDAKYDVGITALALLAFLGRGYTHLSRESYQDPLTGKNICYGDVVYKAIVYLQKEQEASGKIAGGDRDKYMYNHAIATMALAEAFGMTNEPLLKPAAEKAIDYLLAAQNRTQLGGATTTTGWRYRYRYAEDLQRRGGASDTSVTGWCVLALKSAALSELRINKIDRGYDGAYRWIQSVTDDTRSYLVGYDSIRSAGLKVKSCVCPKDKCRCGSGRHCTGNCMWANHPTMTAIGVLTRLYVKGNPRDPAVRGGIEIITRSENLPRWEQRDQNGENQIDSYYWYYAALALAQYTGWRGHLWNKWVKAINKTLPPHQHTKKEGCKDGSWDPKLDRWGFEGGRVYVTAINALTLEVFYRYPGIRY